MDWYVLLFAYLCVCKNSDKITMFGQNWLSTVTKKSLNMVCFYHFRQFCNRNSV